jgi:hypothetical protein
MGFFLKLHSSSFTQRRFNVGFTPEILEKLAPIATHQRLTMRAPHSLKINATGQNRVKSTTW